MPTKKKVRAAKDSQTIAPDFLSHVVGGNGKGKGKGDGYAVTVTGAKDQRTIKGTFSKSQATELQHYENVTVFRDVTSKAREQSLAKHPGKYVGK